MTTALFSMLYRPFEPWKYTERNLRIAKDRDFPIYIAWDDRNSRQDYDRLKGYTANIFPFTSHGHCEGGYRFVSRIEADFVFFVADDEQPSPNMWAFAAEPPMIARYSVLIVPIVRDQFDYKHLGGQERLTWRDGWRWTPRTMPDGRITTFEGTPNSDAPWVQPEDGMGILIWHHLLEAPRSEREEKVRRYTELDPWGDHRTRALYEDFPDRLRPLTPDMKQHLPREIHGQTHARA